MKQKIVIKIQTRGGPKGCLLGCIWRKRGDEGEGFQTKVMKKVAETHGVISVGIQGDDKDKLVVTGDGIDSAKLIQCLRKIGEANLQSLEAIKEKDDKDKPIECTSAYCYPPEYPYPLYICY
ncbi:hypothetical protein E1A91_D12G050200v1 [Gossypium mustelinum]|uniref:HMA domain-containing protein n=1 Tax=Gossypium mustelinum TaxID=34275 RepID=A0A5D2SAR7_GOSMU|nr:hypothetical protein E1A91_D12G050200v1 [Gossypium mustelinum]